VTHRGPDETRALCPLCARDDTGGRAMCDVCWTVLNALAAPLDDAIDPATPMTPDEARAYRSLIRKAGLWAVAPEPTICRPAEFAPR
jgi:hypothetical protein